MVMCGVPEHACQCVYLGRANSDPARSLHSHSSFGVRASINLSNAHEM